MAECKSAEQVVTSISSLANKFVESEKNANNIVDILKYLQVSFINAMGVLNYSLDWSHQFLL